MTAITIRNIPTRQSTAQEWTEWWNELRSRYGKKKARAIWTKAWSIRGTSSANTRELRTFMAEKSDINIEAGIGGKITDIVLDPFDRFQDITEDIIGAGKWVTGAVLVILIGGTAMLVYNIAKAPAESIGTALKYAK
jgi:hypothetical protein